MSSPPTTVENQPITRLWLDDWREPPDASWAWAQTVEEAKEILLDNQISEQSLDHDLDGPDGLTLIVWELDHKLVPLLTILHTWNPAGSLRMETLLHQHRHTVTIEPDPRPPR